MIAYFPVPYKDELAYSLFARFFMKSGYTAERDIMDELYVNKYYRSDPFFFNKLRSDVVDVLSKGMAFQAFIEWHTMFPYYARFLNKARREKALASMLEMDGQYRNLLPISTGTSEQYLRYCPCCVKEDRECIGETYWHRIHQIQGMRICSTHGCSLIKSEVPIGVKRGAGLVPAEAVIPDENVPEYSNNEPEKVFAKYVEQVFFSEMNYDADSIGVFLRNKLDGRYLSETGLSVKMTDLYEDYAKYYSWIPSKMNNEQFQKVFNGFRCGTYEVCQIAFFVGISVEELVDFKTYEDDILKSTYDELCGKYNLSYEIVADIGKTVIKEYYGRTQVKRSSIQKRKWDARDRELLSKVKEVIAKLNQPGEKPVKICAYYVCKQLGINPKSINNMPLCKAEIEFFFESQEKYWARELVWAVGALEASGTPLCWKRIRELTNMRKVNVEAALPYLKVMVDDETYKRIEELL